ncbi:MAG: aryl-sulfate sulfotransferase [Rhodospirillaceae bacterium]
MVRRAFVVAPSIKINPNERAPLVAIVRYKTDTAVNVTLQIDDGRKVRNVRYGPEHDPEKGLPIVGMRANTDHRITVTAEGLDPVELTYRTPILPSDDTEMPTFTTVTSRASEMAEGYTILSIRRGAPTRAIWMTPGQFAFMRDWSMLVALDDEGEVVWYYKADSRIAGVHRLANGNLFYHHVDFRSVEIDMCGNTVRTFFADKRPFGSVEEPGAIGIDAQSLHHQPHEMPNGNYLALTANAREIENYYTSETDPVAPRATQKVVGDKIVEFTTDGDIVWDWNTFDHLDIWRFGYLLMEVYWHTRGFPGHYDWTHGNGVSYDPYDDSVLISLRHQDAVVKIDKKTKEIKWILGDHRGWEGDFKSKLLTRTGDFRWHYHGHNPRVTGENKFVMYDNGVIRNMPPGPIAPPHQCFARALEYEVNPETMEVSELWSSSDDDDPNRVISFAMGDAHRLTNGNMLVIDSVCLPDYEQLNRRVAVEELTWNQKRRDEWHPADFPLWGRIREMKHTASREVVYEVHVKHPRELITWECFGGTRVASLSPEGVVES